MKRADEAVQKNPGHLDPLQLGAAVLAARGDHDHDQAQAWLAKSFAMDPDRTLSNGYNVACTYAQIGENDLALEWLERIAGGLGRSQLKWAQTDSDLDTLRGNPRFIQLFQSPGEKDVSLD
ncbi:TPR end-of-group domain-containing protein [Leisingera sp.]|uniref:TPR end-of-group domain-containing protein n=1 Tax=Leisingera sp. TaxID=1879318 RepID=UPI002B27A918|nr:hypothetical protein [Leisingera sp.]